MVPKATIAGFAVLLFATFAAREACAGLMSSDTAMASGARMSAAAMSGDQDTAGAAAEPKGDRPRERRSAGDDEIKLPATQPAQSGAGATGSATSTTSGCAPAALFALSGLPTPPAPAGYCVELKNSALPSPPTSDLLRPPKRDV